MPVVETVTSGGGLPLKVRSRRSSAGWAVLEDELLASTIDFMHHQRQATLGARYPDVALGSAKAGGGAPLEWSKGTSGLGKQQVRVVRVIEVSQ
jgi:hypothetical protein